MLVMVLSDWHEKSAPGLTIGMERFSSGHLVSAVLKRIFYLNPQLFGVNGSSCLIV